MVLYTLTVSTLWGQRLGLKFNQGEIKVYESWMILAADIRDGETGRYRSSCHV